MENILIHVAYDIKAGNPYKITERLKKLNAKRVQGSCWEMTVKRDMLPNIEYYLLGAIKFNDRLSITEVIVITSYNNIH